MPLEFRVGIVCLIAAFVAGQINRGIFRLAWMPRDMGPWSPPAQKTPPRKWWDRLPIIGWFGLARESPVHGAGFWHRPFLIELGFVLGMAFLYVFELHQGLYPIGAAKPMSSIIHAQFAAHFTLIALMIVATFIDMDEKIIPDQITVPGTLLGLLIATLLPESLLPVWNPLSIPPIVASPLTATEPFAWPNWFDGPQGLVIGVCCIAGWVYGLMPKTLWYRGGVVRFWRYLFSSIVRHPHTKWYMLAFVVLTSFVASIWIIGGARWQSLLTSLLGIAGGGAIVWGIRVFASATLGKEAMGFGDVTLMAMIGAFLGWQATVVIFFVAPFTGSLIAIGQLLIYRKQDIPYGPFLASAALVCIVVWPIVWSQIVAVMELFTVFAGIFGVGVAQLMAVVFGGFFVLVALCLLLVRVTKSLFRPRV
ncbi:prepilin peptidase [Planctomycetota bacterium]